jgi:DNA invertase Pin-like site-specific DNA recombinase
MPEPPRIQAAQYLRMSTDHQRYSLANQAQAIAAYAAARGFELTRSYFDPGKSGVTIEGRDGLQSLLRDALHPDRDFDAVLVLDVSRWGRFQDHDEAAHYEFICRSAGVPVIYCGEPFENNQTPVASLMKLLKRLMAAEFSRDLSEKIHQGQLRLARLGYHAAGTAIYGFRRVALSATGDARQVLETGAPKPLSTDRVALRPGPPEEIAVIRWIFRRFVRDDRSARQIALELEAGGVDPGVGRRWTTDRVRRLLRNELVVGVSVTRRTRQRLHSKRRPAPIEDWVRVEVSEPVIPRSLFAQAQARFESPRRFSEAAMLRCLKKIWRRHGRITAELIDATPEAPSYQSYANYFGSLKRAYDAIGYQPRRPEPKHSSDELLEALRAAHKRHGYISTSVLAADPATCLAATYRKRFGLLSRAYELAGLPHKHSVLTREAQNHRNAVRPPPERRRNGPNPASNDELLEQLRRIQAARGGVSRRILEAEKSGLTEHLFRRRFGSLTRAYILAGLPSDRTALTRAGVARRDTRRREARGDLPQPPGQYGGGS